MVDRRDSVGYSNGMSETKNGKRLGRPPGTGHGETPKRGIRIGGEWDRAFALALRLAELTNTVRVTQDRATGELVRRGDITTFVTEAIRRECDRVEKVLKQVESDSKAS
jgi:hypothetical protein